MEPEEQNRQVSMITLLPEEEVLVHQQKVPDLNQILFPVPLLQETDEILKVEMFQQLM